MKSKKCNSCNQIKPLSKFYKKTVGTWHGYFAICKDCIKEKQRIRYSTSKYRKWHRQNAKQHRLKYPEKYKNAQHKFYKNHRSKVLHKNKTIYKKQKWARAKVQTALETGKLIKPAECEFCYKKTKYLHAHHKDYSKPLEIIWLCKDCHGHIHAST